MYVTSKMNNHKWILVILKDISSRPLLQYRDSNGYHILVKNVQLTC